MEGREHLSPKGEFLQSVLTFDLQELQMAMPVPPHVSKLSHCFCTKLFCCETSSSCLCALWDRQAQASTALGMLGGGDGLPREQAAREALQTSRGLTAQGFLHSVLSVPELTKSSF